MVKGVMASRLVGEKMKPFLQGLLVYHGMGQYYSKI